MVWKTRKVKSSNSMSRMSLNRYSRRTCFISDCSIVASGCVNDILTHVLAIMQGYHLPLHRHTRCLPLISVRHWIILSKRLGMRQVSYGVTAIDHCVKFIFVRYHLCVLIVKYVHLFKYCICLVMYVFTLWLLNIAILLLAS